MPLHHPALKHLRDRVGRDEPKATQNGSLACQQFGRTIPPVHDEVSGLIHVRVNRPQCFSKSITKARAQKTRANKRWIADDEFRRRPFRPSRVRVGLLALDDFRDGFAIPCQHRILDLNVLERAQDRLIWCGSLGSEMPLQVTNPKHQFSNRRSAGIDLKPEELMWIDAVRAQPAQGFLAAEIEQRLQHFAFQPLHQFQRDVEEVASAAGGI